MTKARRNPLGLPVRSGVRLVRVGDGEHTHIWHPEKRVHICESGLHLAKGNPEFSWADDSSFATCYRCAKLGSINLEAGRPAWKGPRD